ncbi:hypothetical protein ACFL38_00275 [Candidatus Omnitrophota bacterium]
MKRFFLVIVLLILVGIGSLFVFKDIIAQRVFTEGLGALTGLQVIAQDANAEILDSLLAIKGIKVFNPWGFEDKVMVSIPELFIDFDVDALFDKKIHLWEVRFNLAELMIVKNEKGEVNINSIKVIADAKDKKEKSEVKEASVTPEFLIDVLDLKIGTVIYKDYSGEEPQTTEFAVNIDERFENISDSNVLVKSILAKALLNTTIANLGKLDFGVLQEGLDDMVSQASEMATENFDQTVGAGKQMGEEFTQEAEETLDSMLDIFKPESDEFSDQPATEF